MDPFSAVVAALFPSRSRRFAARWWGSVRDRIDDWGDRAGLNPTLLAFAVRFPLTRPVARRRAAALFDLCGGFVYSQVLVACVRLDLFTALRDGPMSEARLAERLGLPAAGTRRLLEAAAALRLVRRVGAGRYRLGPLGRAVAMDPGIAAMVDHHALLYADLADPVALLRGEPGERSLGAFWSYSGTAAASSIERQRTQRYTRLMSASQGMVSREIVDRYPFRRHRRLLDVGGGDGTFLEAVAAAAPDLAITLFDLPSVAAEAEARFARAGLSARARTVGGDFRHDSLPVGADLVSLVRVLHDHDDATVAALLVAVRRAMPPGGTLLVAEPLADTRGAERVGGAYFGFYLMAMGQGRPRSASELQGFLRQAGFICIEQTPTSLPIVTGLLVARVPD